MVMFINSTSLKSGFKIKLHKDHEYEFSRIDEEYLKVIQNL